MLYSQETIDRACTANRVMYWDLSRHIVKVEDAIESQEYEDHKDSLEKSLYPESFISAKEQETKEFMTMHQGNNMSFSA